MARRPPPIKSGLNSALLTRARLNVSLSDPIDPFDAATALGIEVRYMEVNSLEGVYSKGIPAIVIGTLRPRGRRGFTCGHEIGHHVHDHGDQVDAPPSGGGRRSITYEERVADSFASFFLMPKLAVESAMRARGVDKSKPTALEILILADLLGVGYSTLVHHASRRLRLFTMANANRLLKSKPIDLKREVLGFDVDPKSHLAFVDVARATSVSVEVGDYVAIDPYQLLPTPTSLAYVGTARNDFELYRAVAPGEYSLPTQSAPALRLRIARCGYVGRHIHKYRRGVANPEPIDPAIVRRISEIRQS